MSVDSLWNPVTVTTAVIAVLGLLVAGGSLWVGITNARHNRLRDFPTPHWQVSWDVFGERGLTFTARNIGRGQARDTRLEYWVHELNRWRELIVQGDVGYNDQVVISTMSSPEVFAVPNSARVRLRWREDMYPTQVRVAQFTW